MKTQRRISHILRATITVTLLAGGALVAGSSQAHADGSTLTAGQTLTASQSGTVHFEGHMRSLVQTAAAGHTRLPGFALRGSRPMDSWGKDTCDGSPSSANCDNTDPGQTGCAHGATTVGTAGIYNHAHYLLGTVELRHSSTCQTYWTKIKGVATAAKLPKAINVCGDYCLPGYEQTSAPIYYSNQVFGLCGVAWAYMYSRNDGAWDGTHFKICSR